MYILIMSNYVYFSSKSCNTVLLQYTVLTVNCIVFFLFCITLLYCPISYCIVLFFVVHFCLILINFVLDSVYLLWWWITKYCFVLFSKILYYTSLYYSMLLCYYVFSVIMFLIYWVLLVQINVSLNYFVFCQVVMCYVVIFSLITLY